MTVTAEVSGYSITKTLAIQSPIQVLYLGERNEGRRPGWNTCWAMAFASRMAVPCGPMPELDIARYNLVRCSMTGPPRWCRRVS